MQKHVNLKHVTLLLGLLLTAVWCGAREIGLKDGFSNINIKDCGIWTSLGCRTSNTRPRVIGFFVDKAENICLK